MYCVIFVHFVYSSALNTQLVDNTFPEDDFEVVLGSLEVKWQRIGPYLSLSWTFFNTCICFWNHSVLYIVYIWCIRIMRIYNMNTILLCWKASQLAFFTFFDFLLHCGLSLSYNRFECCLWWDSILEVDTSQASHYVTLSLMIMYAMKFNYWMFS